MPPRLAVEPPEFPIGPNGGRLRGDLIYSGRRGMRSFHAQWLWLLVSLLVCVPASIFAGVAGGAAGMLLLALPGLIWLPLICKSCSWRYQVYQYRVDFETGLLSKRKHSVWLWQILDVEYNRSQMGWLTNTAARSDSGRQTAGQSGCRERIFRDHRAGRRQLHGATLGRTGGCGPGPAPGDQVVGNVSTPPPRVMHDRPG